MLFLKLTRMSQAKSLCLENYIQNILLLWELIGCNDLFLRKNSKFFIEWYS
jgi:lipid-A-disaccharide synthase-like uncharacterized protein